PDLRVAEAARRAQGAEPVAPLRPFDAHQSIFHLSGTPCGEGLPRKTAPTIAAHRLEVPGSGGVVRASVERIDALVVAEADAGEHLLGVSGLGAHLADGVLDLLREEGRVDLPGREELLDELLVLPGEPVRLLVGEPGELAPQRLPEGAPTVLVEAREQLHEDPLAKAGGMHGD